MRKLISALVTVVLVTLTTGFAATTSDLGEGTLTIAKHWDEEATYSRPYPALATEFTVTEMQINGQPVDVFGLTASLIGRQPNDVLDLPIGADGDVDLPGIGTAQPTGAQYVGLADQSGFEFFSLPDGLYLIQETDTPDGIPASKPSLVTIPLYQDGIWDYEPDPIVPKNYPQLDVTIKVEACINPIDPVAIKNGTEECVKELVGTDSDSANVLVTVKIQNASAVKAHTVEGYLEPPTGFSEWLGSETATEVPASKDEADLESKVYYVDVAGNTYPKYGAVALGSRGRSAAVGLDESSVAEVHFPVDDLDVGEWVTYTLSGVVHCEDSGEFAFPVYVETVDEESDYTNNTWNDSIKVFKTCTTVNPPSTNPPTKPPTNPPTPPTTPSLPPQALEPNATPAPLAAAPIRLLGRLTRTGVSLVVLAITAALATTGYAVARRNRKEES